MKLKTTFKSILFSALASATFSVAHAQQVTVTIGSGGNTNSSGVFQAWCLDSGTSCKVTGNRTHHSGPRSCAMLCDVDEIAVFSCEPNNDDRWVDEIYVDNAAVEVDISGDRHAYAWVVSESDYVSCSYTD